MAFPAHRAGAARMAGAAIGAAAGLWLALPVADVQQICPAPGEGRTQCVLNEVWLSTGLHVLLAAMIGALAVQLAQALPGYRRARRAGTVLGEVAPMDTDDELLVAATWGRTYVADGRTAVLRAPRVRWHDPADARFARPGAGQPRDASAPAAAAGDGRRNRCTPR